MFICFTKAFSNINLYEFFLLDFISCITVVLIFVDTLYMLILARYNFVTNNVMSSYNQKCSYEGNYR